MHVMEYNETQWNIEVYFNTYIWIAIFIFLRIRTPLQQYPVYLINIPQCWIVYHWKAYLISYNLPAYTIDLEQIFWAEISPE